MIDDRDKWLAIHSYRKAVALGLAPPILCPDCQYELVSVVSTNTEPVLRCMSCRVIYTLGADTWDQILDNIHEVTAQLEGSND